MQDVSDLPAPESEPTPETPAVSASPAGWYPDGAGGQRYWDGTAWGQAQPAATPFPSVPAPNQPYQPYQAPGSVVAATSDDRTMGALAHALSIVASFLAPLIIYLVKGNDSAFVRHHAAEALNFAITVFLAWVVAVILAFVLVGFLLMPVIGIGALVLNIMAALAASRGELYRYPVNIRLVPGAIG